MSPYEWNILEQNINKLQLGSFPLKAKLDTKNISGSGGVNIVQRKGSDSLQVRDVIKISKVHRSKKDQRTNLKQT